MAIPWLGSRTRPAPPPEPELPPPPGPPPLPATTPPPRYDPHEKLQLRAAAARAPQVLPGPVAEYVARELRFAEEFGYRMDGQGVMRRMVHWIQTAPTLPADS